MSLQALCIDLIHGGEVIHVREEDRATNDIRDHMTRCADHGDKVLHDLSRLRGDVTPTEHHSALRIKRDLSGKKRRIPGRYSL